MSMSDELEKLERLLERGTLTPEEFQQAKQRILSGQQAVADPHPDLELIKQQNAVAELDRQWGFEQQNYLMTGRYGNRFLPTKAGSFFGGLVIVAFGIFWTCMAAGMGAPVFFPLFGVIFILFGAATSVQGFLKATQYQDAYARYQTRRRDLQSRGSGS